MSGGSFQERNWTGGWFGSATSGPFPETHSKAKSGGPVANFRDRIRRLQSATGNYQLTIIDEGLATGSAGFQISNPNQGGNENRFSLVGVIHTNPLVTAPSLPSNTTDAQARINFLKKVRGSRRSFQGGVFLGELKEAIHMVTRPAEALRRAVTTYSRAAKKAARRTRGAKNVAKAISGSWLEHSYGWRPLLGDIDDAMKALADVPPLVADYVSGFAQDEFKPTSSSYTENTNNAWFTSKFVTHTLSRSRYKGAVVYDGGSILARTWQQNWGLTLSDFAPTVYELIPYSFLADYFSNLGEIVDAASFGTVSLRWGFCSTVLSAERKYLGSSVQNVGYPANWNFRGGKCSVSASTFRRFTFTRQNVTSISVGISDFQMKVPGIDDWRKWANIGALAVERIL